MSPQRMLGTVLLVVGIILLIVGVNASHSLADQVSDTFIGRFTHATMWYIVGGSAMALVGLLMMLFGVRNGKS